MEGALQTEQGHRCKELYIHTKDVQEQSEHLKLTFSKSFDWAPTMFSKCNDTSAKISNSWLQPCVERSFKTLWFR